MKLLKKNILCTTTLFILFFSLSAQALELKVKSLRLKLSQPETLHTLVYKDPNVGFKKVIYDLDPLNNERLGLFVDLNGFLIGYSIDPFSSKSETQTTDIILSSEKLKHSKISFNYQILEGFNTEAYDAFNPSTTDTTFLKNTKSTRIELLGLHNIHTFKGSSLFSHFFRNRPLLNNKHKLSLSFIGAWSVRRLKLENPSGLLSNADFFTSQPIEFNKINAFSLNALSGPLVSFGFNHNINAFVEGKVGFGYFENLDSNQELKQSGTEILSAFGAGASWTSHDKKFLLILKALAQKGRHIETFNGDLTLIYFL